MKKALLVSALVGIAASAAAQGTVSFGNAFAYFEGAAGILTNGIFYSSNGMYSPLSPAIPGTYTVALYEGIAAGPGVNPDDLILVGLYHPVASDWPIAGFFAGPLFAIPGVQGGQTAYLEVAAWTGNANSWDAAAFGGVTSLFANPTGNPGATPPGVPADLTGWDGNLFILAVPEPSIFALLGLGAGILLFHRRKCKSSPNS